MPVARPAVIPVPGNSATLDSTRVPQAASAANGKRCPEITSDRRDRPAHSVSPQAASAANGYDNASAAAFEGMCDDGFQPNPAAVATALKVPRPNLSHGPRGSPSARLMKRRPACSGRLTRSARSC